MTEKAMLNRLWESNRDRTFSLFSIAKFLKFTTGEVSQVGKMLDEMHREQKVVHGYHAKHVEGKIYKLMKIVSTGEQGAEGLEQDARGTEQGTGQDASRNRCEMGAEEQTEQRTGQDPERFSLYAGARGSGKAIDEIAIGEVHHRIRTCPEWKAKTERVRRLASEIKRENARLERLPSELERIASEGAEIKKKLAKLDENNPAYGMLADESFSKGEEWKRMETDRRQLPSRIKSLEEKRRAAKEVLPAITVSCLIRDGVRQEPSDDNYTHTGLLQLDLDIKDTGINASEVYLQLKQDPHVRLVYFSPSSGVKAFFCVKTPRDKEEHKHAFDAMIRYMDRRYNLKAATDTQVSNLNALCFISHDPAASMKAAEPMPWSPSRDPEQPTRKNGDGTDWISGALDAIDPTTLDYQEWLSIGMALHADNVVDGEKLWDSFSQRDPSRYKGDEIAYKWQSFDGKPYGYTLGRIWHYAIAAGWEPPRRENNQRPALAWGANNRSRRSWI